MSRQVRDALLLLGDQFTDEYGRAMQRVIVQRGRHRRVALRSGLAFGGVAALAALALLAVPGRRVQPSYRSPPTAAPTVTVIPMPAVPAATVPASGIRTVRFEDGSAVTLLNAASTVRPKRVTARATTVELMGGAARFDVVPARDRVFRAEAGNVAIDVLGTVFTVERLGERARVSVEHGRVRVKWPGGQTHLEIGQVGTFPPEGAAVGAASAPAVIVPVPRRLPDRPAIRDEPEDLLETADVARRSRNPRAAVAPLRAVFERFPGDQRAPLAAFTLGRLYLDELREPDEAAAAFARARAMDPQGPLAEHALAREIEAWAAAGARDRATSGARTYLQQYPNGSRTRSVRRLGGLE